MNITKGLPSGFKATDYDMVVVGAGFAGSTVARVMSDRMGYRVAIIEKRDHIGGNAYDFYNEDGILTHLYGPHIYHTFNDRVNDFLTQYTSISTYQHKVLANIHGTLMPVPFNHKSIGMAFGDERGEELYAKLIKRFGKNVKVPIMELREAGDADLTELAEYVYDNIFLQYTMKQWGKTPDQIDRSVTGRVPIYVGDDDRYFNAPHQGMPVKGYTAIFDNMLGSDNIDVFISADVRDILEIKNNQVVINEKPYKGQVIYTGPLDELFGSDMGDLPYRSLDLRFETLNQDTFQNVGTVNYTTSEDFTRITEFKNLTGQVLPGKTTILREYSQEYIAGSDMTPYYAIIEPESQKLYGAYLKRVEGIENFRPVGRLAEYRYYDMDAVIDSALDLCDSLVNSNK